MSINQTQARAQSPRPSTNPSTNVNRGSNSNSSSTTNLGGSTTPTRVNVGPKHHTYPKTTPPRNPKYNPIPPEVTPESTLSQSNSQHSKSSAGNSDATHVHREDVDNNMDVDKEEPINPLAILNAVAPPSLTLPPTLSLASTTSSNAHSHWYWKPQQSMSSSKHGSPIVSPSPSSFPPSEVSISCEEIPLEMALALSPPGTPGASYSISQERNVVAFVRECDSEKEGEEQKSTTKSEGLPEVVGEYIQKSIAFGGGQALPFAIEEEEELESGDGTESSSFYTTTSASASASATAPSPAMQKAERTKSSHSAGAGSKKNRRAGSFKGRSIRKRIRRIFGGSKGTFKAGDRVQI